MLLILLVQANLAITQTTGTYTPEKGVQIDSFLKVLAENNMFNGAVLIAEQGRIVYQKGFGYASFESKIPNSDTTAFNLASLSKPFTALAVLQLAEKGKLKLDDVFAKYFPDFPYPLITIRQLLNHSSGLPQLERFEQAYITAHPDEIISNEKAYAHLLELKGEQMFQPGEDWRYGNINYVLLALLVEQASKMPFTAYMKKNIFIPSGMQKTYVRSAYSPNTPRYTIPTMFDTVYQNVDSIDRKKNYTYYNLGALEGPNNIISTLSDLFHFDNALSAGKLLKSDLLKEAYTPLLLNNGKRFFMRGSNRSYGLGWNIIEDSSAKYVFHDGHIVGLTTIFYKSISRNQTIIFYENSDAPAFFQKLATINRILNGLPLTRIRLAKSLARVYGAALVAKGADYAIAKFNELKQDSLRYYVDELEINSLGLDLLTKTDFPNSKQLALEVLKINTILYPKSANTYDSYAEALAKNGKREEAIAMYRKSILLNPGNKEGEKALNKLMAITD